MGDKMERNLTASDLMQEFRLFYDGGDSWGTTMAWWFAIAGELNERGLYIPDAWKYRPGLGGGKDPDAYETEICEAATDDGLQLFGRAITRYAAMLKTAGKDY